MSPLGQTSNDFDIPGKTPVTSYPFHLQRIY